MHTDRPHSMLSRPAQWALAVGFAALATLPSLDWALAIDPTPPPQENRTLAPAAPLPGALQELLSWPGRYEAWFRDHFGLRNTLIAWHSQVMLDVLGVSPSKDVLIGKDGWLFLGADKNVNAYRCMYPYTDAELRTLQAELEKKAAWLAKRGIAYLNVWVPIKANVYPEYLPPGLRKLDQPCRLKQWYAHMRKHTKVAVVDLTEDLVRAKAASPELLYFKTDTHWNPRGAWAGYRALVPHLQHLGPKFRQIVPSRVTFEDYSDKGGDLARLIDMAERYRAMVPWQKIAGTGIRNVPAPVDRGKGIFVQAYECATCGIGKAVMIHDSFGDHIRTYLAESFARLVSVEFGPWDEPLIELEKPDVVIEVHLERQLTP